MIGTPTSTGRNDLTDRASNLHCVRLLDGLAAVEEQFDFLSRLQGQRGVAGSGCVIHPADGAHGTLIRRELRGHGHCRSGVWFDHRLETFWRIRSEVVGCSAHQELRLNH